MWNYSEKVMDHFYNPRNMGTLPDANAVGKVGSIVCGDALQLALKIKDNKILDARFQTFGCGSAIASSSMLTEMIKGKSIEEAVTIRNEDIAAALGGLPPEKMHCSVMGREALDAAIANYRGQSGEHIEEDHGRLICRCFGVFENKIRKQIIENHLKTVEDVTNYTKAGGGCRSCHPDIQEILDDVWKNELAHLPKEEEKKVEKPATAMTNVQKIMKIQKVIESEIQPALMVDGGSIELIDVAGNRVEVKFHGACSTCPARGLTIKGFVERVLKEKVLPALEVEVK
jgi:NifU-like protein